MFLLIEDGHLCFMILVVLLFALGFALYVDMNFMILIVMISIYFSFLFILL